MIICANCGTELPPTAKFCLECGGRVAPARAAPSPEAYTPRYLAERILTARAALEGERKQVTVLFADLKGSMEMLADRDPEEARAILDPVLAHMMDAVHRYEGTVNQVMGDGIMALFGAPVAHEDHAVRACYAALRMQESLGRYVEEARRSHGVTVQIRVGLNSGDVVVRAIGSDLRMDYTAIGETTHLAARMEQLARPGTVLIAPATFHLAEGFVAVTPLGRVPVKGRREPVEVYELSGLGPARTRLQAAARRGLTRFVGRDAEIEALRRALERAGSGHGQVVAVVGEAGVGKSRLHWEFTRSRHAVGWLALRGRSVSYGRGTPYLPVIELLKTYLGLQERDDPRTVRARVADTLKALDRALEALATPLLVLLDAPIDDAAWNALDPPQRRQRMQEAVIRLLLRGSQVQPLVLVFADLQWIDSESQALLEALIERVPTERILLLVSYRPEYRHAWPGKPHFTELRIEPLAAGSAEALLADLLGQDESLETLERVLIERTEGNPFFLEESVQALVESGVLVGERGAYRMMKVPQVWPIPATAQAIVAARIDRLPPEEKALLQAASVIGEDVPCALLRSIADMNEASLRRALTDLERGEFLYEAGVGPDLSYTFKQTLTHEVAYTGMLHDRRRALHARIAGALETLPGDRPAELVERLAHHAFRGELWDEAVTYLRQAGARALDHSAYREAATRFEQALTALRPLPETRGKIERAVDLRLELRQSLFPLNELTKVWSYLEEAEALARTLDDPRRLGWVSAYMSGHHWHTGGHVAEMRRFAVTVEGIAERLDDVPLRIAAHYYLAGAAHLAGDYRAAERVCRSFVKAVQDQPARERFRLAIFPAVVSRAYLARVLAELGEFDEGDAHGGEAIRTGEAVEHPFSVTLGCVHLAYLKRLRGELPEAVRLLERAVAEGREWNITSHTPIAMASLGHAYALSGRSAEGVSCLRDALAAQESAGIGVDHSLGVYQLGEAYLLADQLESARACADRAATLARGRGERGYEAWALRLLADIESRHVRPDGAAAAAYYGAAITLASELEMRPLLAHCHAGLGRLYRRTGDLKQAREHLATARAMYAGMGMTYWVETLDAD